MSRGRHTLPEPPGSDVPVLLVGLVVSVAAVVAVWLVDESWVVQAASTGIIVVLALLLVHSWRRGREQASALWREALDRRRELTELQRQLADVRHQHLEVLLELRALRDEVTRASEVTAQALHAADEQREVMADLLMPRPPVADPVYPSLHLPLVRAAFAAEFPVPTGDDSHDVGQSSNQSDGRDVDYGSSDESTGGEPFPPRQLLDLTASEIARLRPAN